MIPQLQKEENNKKSINRRIAVETYSVDFHFVTPYGILKSRRDGHERL